MRHSKIVKRSIVGLLLLAGLFFAGLEVLSRMYQEKAGAFFREKFSKQSDLVLLPFKTTVSVWTHFPRISFNLTNLALVDTSSGKPVTVLGIKRAEIAVPLGQFDIDHLKISRVDLTGVLFFQKVDSLGNKIGLRFKKIENPDTTGSKLPFVIPKLVIKDARFITENDYFKSAFSLQLKRANLRATLKDQVLAFSGTVAGKLDSITSENLILFRNEPFSGKAHYAYNLKLKTGTVSNGQVTLNKHQIKIAGTHTALPGGNGANLNFKISGNQPILYLLAQLLPNQARNFLTHIKTESNMQFLLHITGKSAPTVRPRNVITFALRQGEIYLPGSNTSIKEVNLIGEMDNGTAQTPETSRLTISDFSANTREDSFKVAMEIRNFSKPAFRFMGEGRMHLKKLAAFVKLPASEITSGTVTGKISLNGTLPDSLKPQMSDWTGRGSVMLQHAFFRPTGLTVGCSEVNGGIKFKDNLLEMDGLQGLLGGQPFKLQASISNFLAYLFDQPGAIKATANIYAATLKTDWLEKKTIIKKKPAPKPAKTKIQDSFRQASLRGIATQIYLKVADLYLPVGNKIRNVVVQVDQKDEKVTLTRMRFTSGGGGVAVADGGFNITNDGLEDPYLHVRLNYPLLDFQDFMKDLAAYKKSQKPVAKSTARKKNQTNKKPAFMEEEDYRLTLEVKAKQIRYVHLTGKNLLLRASLNSNRVKITQLDFASSGGTLHFQGTMQLDAPNQTYPIRLRAELHHLNLEQLMAMAEKMKLDVLNSRNIKGSLDCNMTFLTTLDQTFVPAMERTTAYVKATFKGLELIEVAPIQKALRMLKKEKTEHLYFEDMTTRFILNDNRFLTPGFTMNSNLTAFNLSGTYTMGGGADINMDVGVMNMLLGNNKRRIKKIQAGDSTLAPGSENKQHLIITREQAKYKVKLSNRKQREARLLALKQEYQQLVQQQKIDTVFTLKK